VPLTLEVLPDAEAAAARGAQLLAAWVRDGVAARGGAHVAASGGRAPWAMWRAFAGHDLPWRHVHVWQVDERAVGPDDPARNWLHLREALRRAPLAAAHVHPMPVEEPDLASAAAAYAARLADAGGAPPVLDAVHLGLGPDGHTASLVPGDPVLELHDAWVGVTQPYQGHRRMTLTFPVLCVARHVLWLVTGADKRDALAKLRTRDATIPASHVAAEAQVVVADRDAAQ
jgi:6-phosphogluconolactonase